MHHFLQKLLLLFFILGVIKQSQSGLTCPSNEKLVARLKGCENSCEYRNLPKPCPFHFAENKEGCVCQNDNYVRNAIGDCVPPSYCHGKTCSAVHITVICTAEPNLNKKYIQLLHVNPCGANTEFSGCGKPVICQPQCIGLIKYFCINSCTADCNCKKGFIRYEGDCIPEGRCRAIKKQLSKVN